MAWTDIRDQAVAVRMLQAHLAQGRLAPAYLFVGPEGVGKRLAAAELAKALNCEQHTDEPCDQCGSCARILRGVHPDLHLLTPQGPSHTIPIDGVRKVLERIALRPYMGRRCVVILDGADRLTEEAANSLLKALEEPPSHTTFVAITSHLSRCLPTIVSRCQIVRFQRLSTEAVEALLPQAASCDPQLARSVSRLAQGSLTNAVKLATDWKAHQTMWTQLGQSDAAGWLAWNMPTDRDTLAQWLRGSIEWLRDVVVASVAEPALVRHQEALPIIHRQAREVDRDRCLESALHCVQLWTSLTEQYVNPRLGATLLREQWCSLLERGT